MSEEIVTGTGVPESMPDVVPAVPAAPFLSESTVARFKGMTTKTVDDYLEKLSKKAEKEKARQEKEARRLKPHNPKSGAQRQKEYVGRERAKEDAAAELIGSDYSPKDSEAKDILRECSVKNPHVQDVVIQEAKIAATHFRIPYNNYLLRNGLRKTLADIANPPEPTETTAVEHVDEVVDGEFLFRQDLRYLWDFGYFRQSDVTFEQWLEIRFKCKNSAFFLGKEIIGMDFHDLHEAWSNFFPRFDPRGLKPNFAQEDAKAWLAQQCKFRCFVLQCSRNSYKSSFSAIWVLTLILSQPCVRIRLVTETDDLASDFVAAIKRYFVLQIPDSPTLFGQLFAEFSIAPDSGRENMYECPLAHLNLVAATVEASSMSGAQAGRRCDVLLCDDLQSEKNTASDPLLEKSLRKFDLLQKLVEVSGLTISLSTPWDVKDISGTLIKRAEEDTDTLTTVRIDPAWHVLPNYEGMPVLEMKEHMVKLSFPERLTFNFLMSEAKKNVKLFMSQNLCVFPDKESSKVKVQFSMDALQAAIRSPMFFDRSNQNLELVGTYTGIDTAWSVAATADYSALVTIKTFKERQSGRFIMAVTDIRLVQMRINELAIEIVDCFKQNRPDRVIVERSGAWQSLAVAIQVEMNNRQLFPIPDIYWKPTAFGQNLGGSKNKTIRIKGLEAPLATGQLLFQSHHMLDEFFKQMTQFTGSKSSASRHDDGPDALSLVAEIYFFPLFGGHVAASPEDTEIAAAAALQQTLDAHYSRVFGSRRGDAPQPLPVLEEPDTNPLTSHLAKFGMFPRRG